MKTEDNIFLGIDIGNAKICVAICHVNAQESCTIKGVGTSVSEGIQKGLITNEEALYKSIDKAIKRAEQNAGITSNKVLINIPAQHCKFLHNMGFLISKEDSGQISNDDRVECIKRSKNIALTNEDTLLHAVPLTYKVEGTIVQNPIGVFGQSLELQTHLVIAKSQTILTLKKILNELNFVINGFICDPLAQSESILTSDNKQTGTFLMDFGSGSTKVSVFKYNMLQQTVVIPIGSHLITSDIATCLRVNIPEAERLKILYGDVQTKLIDPEETIEITTEKEGRKTIKKLLLSQIIEARIKELLSHIDKQLPYLIETSFPIVLNGGGSLLKGLSDYIETYYNKSVLSELPQETKPLIESSAYATAVGLILYGLKTKAINHTPEKHPWLTACKQWAKKYV